MIKVILLLLILSFQSSLLAKEKVVDKYVAWAKRNRAIHAYTRKACFILSAQDEEKYCRILQYNPDIKYCETFSNKHLKENCIEDVKILLGVEK